MCFGKLERWKLLLGWHFAVILSIPIEGQAKQVYVFIADCEVLDHLSSGYLIVE